MLIAAGGLLLAAAQVLLAWLQLRRGMAKGGVVVSGGAQTAVGPRSRRDIDDESDSALVTICPTCTNAARLGGACALLGGLLAVILGAEATGAMAMVAVVLLVSTLVPAIVAIIRNGDGFHELVVPAVVAAAGVGTGLV